MTGHRGQSGFALIELVTVMSISIVMLSAVLLAYEGFQRNANQNAKLNESQSRTRQTVGQLARDLRNLASPTPEQPQAIDSAAPYDLVFQTVNPNGGTSSNITNVQRVRYCLDAPSTGDSALWAQTQTWTTATIPSMPVINGCPSTGTGWGTGRKLVTGITNRTGNRPLFLYNAAIKTDITTVAVEVWARAAEESEPRLGVLRTQVFLRNQNQAPTATFTATTASTGHVLLNGSASSDPEGDELRYDWYLDQTPDCRTGTPPAATGSGIVYDMTASAGPHSITLIVYDSAGLCARQTQNVVVS